MGQTQKCFTTRENQNVQKSVTQIAIVGKYVEIWNNVFMKYFKHKDGTLTELKQHNVDTGLGLERMTMLLQGKQTPFETETICSSNGQVRRTTKSR